MRPAWVLPFLETMRATGNVAASARVAGVSSAAPYNLRERDADFACEWDNALEDATDTLELEARRRAVEGVAEPVVYQGQLTPVWERDEHGEVVLHDFDTGQVDKAGNPIMGQRPRQLVIDGKPQWLTVTKKSDPLLMFLLKGLRKKYGTETTELTGKDGAPVAIDSAVRAARVAALLEQAKRRKDVNVEDLA